MRIPRALAATALAVSALLAVPARAGAAPAEAAGGQPSTAPRTPDAAARYVAMGDSYSSGTGAGDYQDLLCTRSDNAYPAQWADAHAPESFAFVACGGATIPDVLANQLSALDENTTLVSLSIGGNDAGFARLMLTCRLSTEEGCRDAVDEAGVFVREELPGQLDGLYQAVRERAPRAKVVVVGYPYLYATGGSCPLDLSEAKREVLHDGADLLDDTIAARAEAAGFTFADARPAFAGHEICTEEPWIDSVTIHPTADGHTHGYLPVFAAAAE